MSVSLIVVLCYGFLTQYVDCWYDWLDYIESPLHRSYSEINYEEINSYVNLISKAQENGLTYKLPKNAAEHLATEEKLLDFGKFDFIIIGAGSAGTVLANRLSEIPEWSVLLLEAGSYGNNLTDIPNMYFPVEFTEYNWGFMSTPQKSSCLGMVENRCPLARGKGIGGTTLINGLVYSRGSRIDFDKWAALGNPGWSFEEVLPYFKKSERFDHRDIEAPVDNAYHGLDGYLNVEYHLPRSPQLDVFLEANEEIGVPIADYNAGNGLGASPAQINTQNGRRFDGGKAFIKPVLNRKNLRVLPNSYVTKILIDETNVVSGVLFTNNGQSYTARISKEVILSAGAINSPHLLMLSGIGPKKHLEELDISVQQNLEVGTTLRDHPTFYGLNFETNYTEPTKPLAEYVKDFLNGFGSLAAPGNNQGVAFYESMYTRGTGLPDIEIMMIPANATTDLSQKSFTFTNDTYNVLWGQNNRPQTFVMYVVALHAQSVGNVRLKSKNPFEYPVINTRFLSDIFNKDITTLYEGIQIALKLARTRAFQRIGTKLQGGPLPACSKFLYTSMGYWYCALRQLTMNLYHSVGTCPMGPDPRRGAVVNAECKVYGVGNLRVVDASVFPFTLAGHPNAATVMVAEKVSDLIKLEHLL